MTALGPVIERARLGVALARSSLRDREPDPLPRREAGSQKANVNQEEWEGQAVKTVI